MIIRVIEKEKWTNKTRPCQKKHGRYTLAMRRIDFLYYITIFTISIIHTNLVYI